MPRDFWIGLVGLGFAGLYWSEAGKIRISPLDGPVGASGLPKALAYTLGILALVLLARSLVARLRQAPAEAEEAAAPAALGERLRPHLRAIGMLALGVGYLLVVPWIGYALALMALILAVALYVGAPLGPRTLAVAVGGGILFHLLFVELLDIPLPKGALIGMFL